MSFEIFHDMIGRTFVDVVQVENPDDELHFLHSDETGFRFYHAGDCCETVEIESITGDLADLIGVPILEAEEVSSEGTPGPGAESFTWTFYKFSTVKGSVTVRWLGTSNGYYSERVDFGPIKKK